MVGWEGDEEMVMGMQAGACDYLDGLSNGGVVENVMRYMR